MKRLFIWALGLLLAAAPASAQMMATGIGGGGFGASAGGGCTEATTFIARTSGLSGTESSAYTTMICGMVTDATWAKMDLLYIFATNTKTTANLNLKSTSFTITETGPNTFTADQGYVSALANNLNTNWTPSVNGVNYTLNSAAVGVYDRTNRTSTDTSQQIGVEGTASASLVSLSVLNVFASGAQYDVNEQNFPAWTGATTAQGSWAANRTASNLVTLYRNGSSVNSNSSPVQNVPNSAPLGILCPNTNAGAVNTGACSSDQIAAAWVGGGLTATDIQNIMARINTYMTAVGANVY